MSIGQQAARAGLWLAGFRFASQALSWVVTIAVARILTPGDYGLMAMASILTGYVEVFSEMGMGAAIIQRETVSREELSSNFWFSLMVGSGFSASVWLLAYPTAWLFNNEAVISLTQAIAVLFLVGALMVVPYNLLTRELRFQEIGMIQLAAVGLSSMAMLWMAYHQYGVWTLLGGVIVLRISTVSLVFYVSGWRPLWHYRFGEVRSYLRFGVGVAGSRSLFYCFQKIDRFVVGKMLGAETLGLYSFAMEMASLPTDKLMSIVNQVSLPLFSRVRNDPAQLVAMYLKVTRYLTLLAAPVFLAGAVFGEDIVLAVLGEQWAPCIFLFRAFCLVQLLVAFSSVHGMLHTAMGYPARVMTVYAVLLGVMTPALLLAAMYGVNALAIPWLVLYPIVWIIWTSITLSRANISWRRYWSDGCAPVVFAVVAIVSTVAVQAVMAYMGLLTEKKFVLFIQEVLIGGAVYVACVVMRDRDTVAELYGFVRPQGTKLEGKV